MSTEQFIYSEEFVRGRMYSYLRFQKYMTSVAEIVCKELDMDEKIVSVRLSSSGDTVFVEFEDSSLDLMLLFFGIRILKVR